MKTFPTRIKLARKKLGFSKYRAAKEWGFAQQTLGAWEKGIRNPAGLYREKLEKILQQIEGQT